MILSSDFAHKWEQERSSGFLGCYIRHLPGVMCIFGNESWSLFRTQKDIMSVRDDFTACFIAFTRTCLAHSSDLLQQASPDASSGQIAQGGVLTRF